jgi:hypothetical protein
MTLPVLTAGILFSACVDDGREIKVDFNQTPHVAIQSYFNQTPHVAIQSDGRRKYFLSCKRKTQRSIRKAIVGDIWQLIQAFVNLRRSRAMFHFGVFIYAPADRIKPTNGVARYGALGHVPLDFAYLNKLSL